MKKLILMLLAAMMAMTTLTAFAEEETANDDVILFEGFVLEIMDGSILVQTRFDTTYEVILTEETMIDGKDIAIGDFINVTYDGTMTFSIPAQIRALHIGNYMLMGTVSELDDSGFLLTFGEEVYQVKARDTMLTGIQDGMFVTVYHTGMMTRSLPAQVSATHIRGHEILGTVTEMVEGGFTLTVEGEELPYHVALKEDALLFVQPEPGMEVIVITDGLQTASLESILVNAAEILPLPVIQEVFDMAGIVTEIGDGFITIQNTEGQEIQVNTFEETIFEGKEIAMGDYIHVTYNGMMTFSIPAQIAAQKIGCYAHTGVIGEMTGDQFTLETDMEPIIVNAPAAMMESIEAGMTVTVYSNGAMTMSLPAQIGAEMITVAESAAE